MPRAILTEARPSTRATAVDGHAGRFLIELATPGWGTSGYYSADVLESAGRAQVFPAGTHMYLDHPTKTDLTDRPERSLRDLAAVLTEAAVWDATAGDGAGALVGEATVFGTYRDVVTEMRDAIGVSLRAVAEVTEGGVAEGRRGRIVNELVEAKSVDFVTRPGRGGRIVEVIESARPTQVIGRAITHGVSEATANDTREALQNALREEYGGEKSWVWVRDFDDTTVWFEHETPDESGTYAEGYSLDESGAVTLAGGRIEVRARTEYVPVTGTGTTTAAEAAPNVTATRPDSSNPNPKETPMGTIQVEESVHTDALAKAGRVDALESERDTEKQRADAAEAKAETLEAEKAATARTTRAAELVEESATTAGVTFTALEAKGLMSDLPVKDDALDEDTFKTAVDEAAKAKAEESGAGRPRGFGRTTKTEDVSESDVQAMIRRRAGTEQKGA